MIEFQATKVFHDIWKAVNETYTNEKGKQQRRWRVIEEVGGSRSSKTWSNFQVIFLYGFENRMKRIMVFRDTAADCRDKVETDWVIWLKDPNCRVAQYESGEITIEQLDQYLKQEDLTQHFIENKQLHRWTFKKSGSYITFTGTDDENKAIGKAQNVFWVNEPYVFPEEVFKQLSKRTSDFIIVDWNPKQNHYIERLRSKSDTFTHRSTLLDNPFCPIESKKEIIGYQPLKYAKVVLDEKISESDAYSYDCVKNPLGFTTKEIKELQRCIVNELSETASEFDYFVYMLGEKAERPNRIYRNWGKITPEEYDALPYREYFYNDWGKNDPWAIGRFKYHDGCLYVREVNYRSENQIEKDIPVNLQREFRESDVEDKENERNEGLAIVKWFYTNLGIPKDAVIVCDSAKPLKITMLRRSGWLHTEPALKGAGSVDTGIDLVKSVKVYYTSDSPNIENEYENYSYVIDRYNHVTDEPEDKDNHHMDGIRYGCSYLVRIGVLRLS